MGRKIGGVDRFSSDLGANLVWNSECGVWNKERKNVELKLGEKFMKLLIGVDVVPTKSNCK